MKLQATTVDCARYTAAELAQDASPAELLAGARMLRILADNIAEQVREHEEAATKEASIGRSTLVNTGEVAP